MTDEVVGLFPIPLMRASAVLDAAHVAQLIEHFSARTTCANNSSTRLSHTEMLRPQDSPLLVQVAQRVTPKLADFGTQLFGVRLGWAIKEMWVNVLEPGGHQAMHNHANSFISGVIYLNAPHADSRTVFMKSPGGTDFVFKHDNARTVPGPFNAQKWVAPTPAPGDALLFPSYLLHAVPGNQGERRFTLAFNAIPARLDSWGYSIGFSG